MVEYKYLSPDPRLSDFVRTVLLVEGSHRASSSKVPLFTNGMPALLYRSVKSLGEEKIEELSF